MKFIRRWLQILTHARYKIYQFVRNSNASILISREAIDREGGEKGGNNRFKGNCIIDLGYRGEDISRGNGPSFKAGEERFRISS